MYRYAIKQCGYTIALAKGKKDAIDKLESILELGGINKDAYRWESFPIINKMQVRINEGSWYSIEEERV